MKTNFTLGGILTNDSRTSVCNNTLYRGYPFGTHDDKDRTTPRLKLKYFESIFSTKAYTRNHLAYGVRRLSQNQESWDRIEPKAKFVFHILLYCILSEI